LSRVWLGLASLLVTCARPQPVQPVLAESAPRPPSAVTARPARSASAAPPPAVVPASRGSLSAFFEALTALGAGRRTGHVRVLWQGDSHTNADFLSGAVRSALAARFGDGGPGFLRIGTKAYRHDGVRLGRDGAWNVDPDPPARRTLQDDGVFGLGGTRAQPKPGASFGLQVVTRGSDAEAQASFDLAYSLPPGASFNLQLGSHQRRVDAKTAATESASGIRHLTLTAPLAAPLSLKPERGAPRFFGVVVERNAPAGVVLDTAGIDGARLETPLAWNEPAFVAEVARRAPELLVVAYGTNESFDATRVSRYGAQLAELVGRLRRGAPDASCLVLGPTDAPLGEGSVPRVAEVTAELRRAADGLGCSFVSLQQLMGGEGSFARGMREKERLCQPDKLHLTPKGYQGLGQALAKLLLDAYSAGRVDL
jgi:lysophospholipase L1-like esterase